MVFMGLISNNSLQKLLFTHISSILIREKVTQHLLSKATFYCLVKTKIIST